MVELNQETATGSEVLRGRVDTHYQEGVARAESYICGLDPPSGVFKPPSDLLPQSGSEWSPDWEERHLQAYVFDSVASTVPIGPANEARLSAPTLESLSSRIGQANYFQAYCVSRMLDPQKVLELASFYLEESSSSYRRQSVAVLGREFGTFEEDVIQAALTAVVTQNTEAYPHARTVSQVANSVRELGLDDGIDSSRESRINLTVNVAHPDSRTSALFLAPSKGLEAYRGAFHALGHSIFSVVAPELIDDYGVNIAATEIVAFQAQHLALDGAPQEVGDFLRFLHLYQSRLYAVRTIHESFRLDSRSPEHTKLQDLGREHLGLASLRPHQFRPKLVGIDFLIAFTEFYRQGEISHTWSSVLELAKATTNAAIAEDVLLTNS